MLMVSAENTRKSFSAMNEPLKKEAEAKVTEKLVLNDNKCGFDFFGIIRCSIDTAHVFQVNSSYLLKILPMHRWF